MAIILTQKKEKKKKKEQESRFLRRILLAIGCVLDILNWASSEWKNNQSFGLLFGLGCNILLATLAWQKALNNLDVFSKGSDI